MRQNRYGRGVIVFSIPVALGTPLPVAISRGNISGGGRVISAPGLRWKLRKNTAWAGYGFPRHRQVLMDWRRVEGQRGPSPRCQGRHEEGGAFSGWGVRAWTPRWVPLKSPHFCLHFGSLYLHVLHYDFVVVAGCFRRRFVMLVSQRDEVLSRSVLEGNMHFPISDSTVISFCSILKSCFMESSLLSFLLFRFRRCRPRRLT